MTDQTVAVCNLSLGCASEGWGLLGYVYILIAHFKHCQGMQSATQLDLILSNAVHSTTKALLLLHYFSSAVKSSRMFIQWFTLYFIFGIFAHMIYLFYDVLPFCYYAYLSPSTDVKKKLQH